MTGEDSRAEAELRCAFDSCVLVDRSDLARLRATGPDFLDLLHRLSTKGVRALAPGAGAATVLTSPKGRIVERLFIHHLGDDGVLVVGGPDAGARLMQHFQRFTFAEKTGLSDIASSTRLLSLVGPRSAEALAAAGIQSPGPLSSAGGSIAGRGVHVVGQDGLSSAGITVLVPTEAGDAVEAALAEGVAAVGGRVTDRSVVESYRVLRGLPASGHELTEEHNPLEAGLWEAVDFDKGCYVGQEVVARLRTYDKVSRALVGLELQPDSELPVPGTKLFVERRAAGTLTSAVRPPGRPGPVALGYLKRREIQPGIEIGIGDGPLASVARLRELPFE